MWRLACFLFYFVLIICGEARNLVRQNHDVTQSHELSDGTIIDCIRIEDQPSLQHAHMKNHIIGKSPYQALGPSGLSDVDVDGFEAKPGRKTQLFHHEVGSCEEGFIPILRTTRNNNSTGFALAGRTTGNARVEEKYIKSYVAKAYKEGSSLGAIGHIQLPRVHEFGLNEDISSTSISVIVTDCSDAPQTTPNWLEAGYMVSPSLFYQISRGKEPLNWDPHLYIFAQGTRDDPKRGCLNMDCGGFVQTSPRVVLGAKITAPKESFLRFELFISTSDGPNEAKWWLTYEHELIGYWPVVSLYQGDMCPKSSADMVMWGGQVIMTQPLSKTGMGSGRKGSRGYGLAAYIADIQVILPCTKQDPPPLWCKGVVSYYIPTENDMSTLEDDPAHFDVLVDYKQDYNRGRGPLYTGVYYGGNLDPNGG